MVGGTNKMLRSIKGLKRRRAGNQGRSLLKVGGHGKKKGGHLELRKKACSGSTSMKFQEKGMCP